MFPIVVPIIATAKQTSSNTEPEPIVMELLSKYTDVPAEKFAEMAKKKLKSNSSNMGLIESIEYIRTLFAFDTCRESRRVSLVNFVLNTNIPGPSWFERVFKGK